MEFRQAIDRLLGQFRRGMARARRSPVSRRAFEPEIRAQVNDLAAQFQQWRGEFRRHPVGQGQKNHLRRLGQQFRFGLAEPQRPRAGMMGEFGENLRERLAGVLPRGHRRQFRTRMPPAAAAPTPRPNSRRRRQWQFSSDSCILADLPIVATGQIPCADETARPRDGPGPRD